MAFAFLRANPALQPLAVAVGAGIGGSLAFGAYYLSHNSDVVVNKKVRDPWNSVQQHSNSKLMSWNDDFWKGRVGMPEPRMAFLQEARAKPSGKRTEAEKSALARARELQLVSKAEQ